jgi:hypothetical protein
MCNVGSVLCAMRIYVHMSGLSWLSQTCISPICKRVHLKRYNMANTRMHCPPTDHQEDEQDDVAGESVESSQKLQEASSGTATTTTTTTARGNSRDVGLNLTTFIKIHVPNLHKDSCMYVCMYVCTYVVGCIWSASCN